MLEFKLEKGLDEKINALENKLKIFSGVRLTLGILLVVFLISLFSLGTATMAILSGLFFAILLAFIIYTNRFYKECEHLKRKKLVYTIHKKRRELNYASFHDTGSEFINKDDYKLMDLDLFGKKSLYQYLCSSKTKLGRRYLADALIGTNHEDESFTLCVDKFAKSEEIIDIEAAIQEFSVEAKTLDYDEFTSLVGKKIELKPIYFLPLLSFIGMIIFCILIPILKLNPLYLIAFLVLNLVFARFLANEAFTINAAAYQSICESYISVGKTVLNTKIDNEYYKSLQEKIKGELASLEKLKGIYSTLASRSNAIFNIGLNALAIIDFWIIIRYNQINKDSFNLNDIFESIARIELMISLCNIGFDSEVYSIPAVGESISGVEMYHPLVKNCKSNSINIDGGIILTGSNMSGKTTFMRTLGVNQILFNAGGIVPAKSYTAPHIPVFTSLRANDMLSEGISTFYAEILRMKRINEAILGGKSLILIDEIFKGTNAFERITASVKVIEKLNNAHTPFIISTHDYELCDCENITNYHFQESYEGDKILFDYTLKDGKCESKNALYLLKMANII